MSDTWTEGGREGKVDGRSDEAAEKNKTQKRQLLLSLSPSFLFSPTLGEGMME